MYDAPYTADGEGQRAFKAYGKLLARLLAAGRRTSAAHRADAVSLFLSVVGMPVDQIAGMRATPIWPAFLAAAPTLAYDYAVMGDGSAVPTNRAATVAIPALIMSGAESPPFMRATASMLSEAMPHAQLRIIPGQRHDVSQAVLAPVLETFFAPGKTR